MKKEVLKLIEALPSIEPFYICEAKQNEKKIQSSLYNFA